MALVKPTYPSGFHLVGRTAGVRPEVPFRMTSYQARLHFRATSDDTTTI